MTDQFLFIGDYKKQIASDNLLQIISNDYSILDSAQLEAIAECKSYLRQKYDISKSFNPIVKYTPKTYNAGQTVYLDAPAYIPTSTYALGSYTLQNGNVYKCTTAITLAESFTISHWTLVGVQYAIFNAVYPNPVFDYLQLYAVGDVVFYKNKVYTCQVQTQLLSHGDVLQINIAGTNQVQNIFPDDPMNGVKYWGNGVAYEVPNTADILNTTYWSQGDNRDQKLLMTCIDIALYHIHARISPRNIPEIRTHRYKGVHEDIIATKSRLLYPTYSALGWLQSCADGNDITPDIPQVQPLQGSRIRFGGNAKIKNQY